MWADRTRLVEPSSKFAPSLISMVQEYRSTSEKRYPDAPHLVDAEIPNYLAYLTLRAQHYDRKPTQVRQLTFWLVRGNEILGVARLRPVLTPQLAIWGGHISYDIRPSQRRQGHGARLLALTLDRARRLRMRTVRLMCYHDNIASKKIIEVNGGELIFQGPCALAGGTILTFEISL